MKKQEIEKLVEMQAALERLQYLQKKIDDAKIQEYKLVPRTNGYAVTEMNSTEIPGLTDAVHHVVEAMLDERIDQLSDQINALVLCKGEMATPSFKPVDIITPSKPDSCDEDEV